MNNSDTRLTIGNITNDKSADSSDLLSMLNIIDQLYDVSCIVINSHSAAAILVSLAMEVQTLLTKLRAMRQRWTVHLPFKEASTVNFVDWSNRTKQLSIAIKTADTRKCINPANTFPSSHCLLDLYQEAKNASAPNSENEDMSDPKQLLQHHAAMQEELASKREQCVDSISQLVSSHLTKREGLNISTLNDLSTIRSSCSTMLIELSEELNLLHEQQVKIFTAKDYERLADRILREEEYEGPIVQREARDIMHNWRNGVPTGKLEESRKEQIELTKEEIRRTKHGVKFEQYVNLDDDFYSQRSEFGRFLFNRRRDITRTELRQLLLLAYCVYYYQKDALQESEPQVPDSVDPDSVTKETCPALPTDFNQRLRESQSAMKRFYGILRKIEPYINKGGSSVHGSTPELCARYKGWTWYHIITAFEQLEFLPHNSNKAAFAQFIHNLFPPRTESSVSRSVYRNPNVKSTKIVADVVKEFQPVTLLMKSSILVSNQ